MLDSSMRSNVSIAPGRTLGDRSMILAMGPDMVDVGDNDREAAEVQRILQGWQRGRACKKVFTCFGAVLNTAAIHTTITLSMGCFTWLARW